MQTSRVTIFAGHYGSGKTNIAINYAIWLKQSKEKVVICDLDIVNPYFRTADSEMLLKTHKIKLISSQYSNSNVDIPAIPTDAQSIFDDDDVYAVIDLGGDDRGALALGRYSKSIISNNYDMLLVFNQYRPLTQDIESLIVIKNEIEKSAKVPFTGIVNNSNLGLQTSLENVLDTFAFADDLSKKTKLQIKMTTISRALIDSEENQNIKNVFPIDICEKTIWKI